MSSGRLEKWLKRIPGSLTPLKGMLKSIFMVAPVESVIGVILACWGWGASWANAMPEATAAMLKIRAKKRIGTPKIRRRNAIVPVWLVKYQKKGGKVSRNCKIFSLDLPIRAIFRVFLLYITLSGGF